MTDRIRMEDAPEYRSRIDADGTASEDAVIDRAIAILYQRLCRPDAYVTQPADAKKYLVTMLAQEPSEVFSVLWLDNRHGVLAFEKVFQGTVDGASVHPRELVRRAITHNAAACIIAHNHPSGIEAPSGADFRITERVRDALALIDVRVLDHIVVGGTNTHSMAEHGQGGL